MLLWLLFICFPLATINSANCINGVTIGDLFNINQYSVDFRERLDNISYSQHAPKPPIAFVQSLELNNGELTVSSNVGNISLIQYNGLGISSNIDTDYTLITGAEILMLTFNNIGTNFINFDFQGWRNEGGIKISLYHCFGIKSEILHTIAQNNEHFTRLNITTNDSSMPIKNVSIQVIDDDLYFGDGVQIGSITYNELSITRNPTVYPTSNPTIYPTLTPSKTPTSDPSSNPTSNPTSDPSSNPTSDPSSDPSSNPTSNPTVYPTSNPSTNPTISTPTTHPTLTPSKTPTSDPSSNPSSNPTSNPTTFPTLSTLTNPTTISTVHHVTLNPSKNQTLSDKRSNNDALMILGISSSLLVAICICIFVGSWLVKNNKHKQGNKNNAAIQMQKVSISNDKDETKGRDFEYTERKDLNENKNNGLTQGLKIENKDIAPSAPTQDIIEWQPGDNNTNIMEGEDEGQNEGLNIDKEGERQRIKDWFDNKVALFEDTDNYFNLFIENGWDKLQIIKYITNTDLQEIGIKKSGHRKAILLATKHI